MRIMRVSSKSRVEEFHVRFVCVKTQDDGKTAICYNLKGLTWTQRCNFRLEVVD